MIVKASARGRSFVGVTAYLMNSTPDMAEDAERVLWANVSDNLLGVEIETAARIMAFTDMNRDQAKAANGQSLSGAKATAGAVLHYSLSWAKDETPEREHMEEAARQSIEALGLTDHQFYMVAHGDRDHSHVHVVANLTHAETGKRAELGRYHEKMQNWARGYEQEYGIKCQAREDNAKKREQGANTKWRDQKQDYAAAVTLAFTRSDSGKAFVHALEAEGLQLGTARRGGYVIVDDRGDIQKLSRQLDLEQKGRAKTEAIAKKLADLAAETVRDGDQIAAEIKARLSQSRESDERERQNKELAAADAHGEKVAAAERAQERKDEAFARHLEQITERQELAKQALETTLAETVGKRLEKDRHDAERLQAITEGRGVMLSLRRLWQGKKDRETLAGIQQDVTRAREAITRAREDLARVHAQEVTALKTAHEKERVSFKDKSLADQIRTLEYIANNQERREFSPYHAKGARKPIEQARRENRERIARQIYNLREAERQAREAAQTEAKRIAQRPAFEQRQTEVSAQDTPKSDLQRTIDRLKATREADKDFER